MAHSNHPDIHDVGLQDDCADCADHAEKPWSNLDRQMLQELIRRNHFYRFGKSESRNDYMPRSDTEAIAMRNITNVLERVGCLMSCDPDGLIQSYLSKNWGVEFD